MDPHNTYSAVRFVSPQQQVSLAKHQEMILNALRWQQMSRFAEPDVKSATVPRLRWVLAAMAQLVNK
jgi:hypothetical protein